MISRKNLLFSLIILVLSVILILPIIKIGAANNFINPRLETPKARQAFIFSQEIVKNIQQNDISALSAFYSELVNKNNIDSFIKDTLRIIPNQAPKNIQLVGLQEERVFQSNQRFIINHVSLEYQFFDKWYLVNLAYSQQEKNIQLLGMRFTKLPNSLESLNKVVLSKATGIQLFSLLMTLIIPIIVFSSLILCIRTKKLKYKWLWIVFIIIGVVGFKFNWRTQTFVINLINLQLFGSGYFRESLYQPLILTFSIPLGAIVFLIRFFTYKPKVQDSRPAVCDPKGLGCSQ